MEKSEVKKMLESLHAVLKAGPSDRHRSNLRILIQEIIYEKRPITDLVEGLKPILKGMATSFLDSGNIQGSMSALSALQCLTKGKSK